MQMNLPQSHRRRRDLAKNNKRSALFPFSFSVAAVALWHKYCSVLCLAEFLETLAVGLMISFDRFVFGRQAQPVGEAVHIGEIAALQQNFQRALFFEFGYQRRVIVLRQFSRLAGDFASEGDPRSFAR